jgi:lysyl-tRNA synthetase class 1
LEVGGTVTEAAVDWVTRTADDVCAEAERRHPGEPATCASGISPSGPVHLGNLRELMVPHLVADEVARRGVPVRHILSWDDYDRLRKVPAGLPGPAGRELAGHIGRPLTAVPDPCGDHPNWAEHFKAPLRAALAELGIEVTEISQTQMYRSGAYAGQVVLAMRRRAQIDAVLAGFRTRRRDQADGELTGPAYYPFRPYCEACGRDDATVTGFDDETTEISYRCGCGAVAGPRPVTDVAGKLAWKVDWPMRWAHERVTFEPAGADHSSPGSSFTVGAKLVGVIFGAPMPLHFGYSFVGAGGSAKLSGSAGGAPTPADALRIFEPPLLRWLYARRQPAQAITLAFGQEVGRVYDEWDALSRAVGAGRAAPRHAAGYRRAAATAAGPLPATPTVLPFRTLASVADITAGDQAQMLRILRDMTAPDPIGSLEEVRPRLDRARAWISEHVPAQERTHVRAEPDAAGLAGLATAQREALALLLDGLDASWSLDGLTTLLYGIPKIQLGLPADGPATAGLKSAQRAWFALLYQLLLGADTGPRLPTLILALGADRVRGLLAERALEQA